MVVSADLAESHPGENSSTTIFLDRSSPCLVSIPSMKNFQSPSHFLSLHDLSPGLFAELLSLAKQIKAKPEEHRHALLGASMAMLFHKPSTRTRVSFEVGMKQLGGHTLFLPTSDLQWNRGETVADTARVLSRYVDVILARLHEHQDLVEMARCSRVPVINGLTNDLHPCQALADYFTLEEIFGDLKGRRMAYVGDGNNMVHSLLFGASRAGMDIAVATPRGYEPSASYLDLARRDATQAGTRITVTHDPAEAVAGASAIYTDVWTSMGQDAEREERGKAFRDYQVHEQLMEVALPEAVFLHCLPCHRGEETTAAVADGPQSRIFDQAENRLYVQKAILLRLLGD